MNRSALVRHMARQANIPPAAAERALASFAEAVGASLGRGETARFRDLGTFSVAEGVPRPGRNPFTGAPLELSRRRFPHFTPSKKLKDILGTPRPDAPPEPMISIY
ncbi:MAG: HU family DNA-binding protein [Acidobacteria bacterium]|nr:HU family DNA-binding protein [Acidobacteriota bacterium]